MLRAFSPNGALFAAIDGGDGRLRVWDVSTGALKHQFFEAAHLDLRYTALAWAIPPKSHKVHSDVYRCATSLSSCSAIKEGDASIYCCWN